MYRAVLTRRFKKQIFKFPRKEQIKIIAKIESGLSNPRQSAVKLEDTSPPVYRIRSGEYRIFFEVDDLKQIMEITDVKRRTTRTYRQK